MSDLMREQMFAQWLISKILALYMTQDSFREEVNSKVNDGYTFSINGEEMDGFEQTEWKLHLVCVDIAKQLTEYYFKDFMADEYDDAEQTEPKPSKIIEAYAKGFTDGADSVKQMQTEPQKKMCANCKHLKKHNGNLADWVCDRKGSIVTNPYDKECDEMWERKDEPKTEPNSSEKPNNCEDEISAECKRCKHLKHIPYYGWDCEFEFLEDCKYEPKDEPKTEVEMPEYAEWKEPFQKMSDCPWK